MRLWAQVNQRYSSRAVAVQIHNDKSGPESISRSNGDPDRLEAMKGAMSNVGQINQHWDKDSSGPITSAQGSSVARCG